MTHNCGNQAPSSFSRLHLFGSEPVKNINDSSGWSPSQDDHVRHLAHLVACTLEQWLMSGCESEEGLVLE